MIRLSRTQQLVLFGFIGALLAVSQNNPAAKSVQLDQIPAPSWRQIALLKDDQINESSGLVVSKRNENCFWTHNDSGDSARLFLVHRDGRTIATFQVKGVKAMDWEDIATAKIGDSQKLIIGDIGGNAMARKSISLHIVSEPRFDYDDINPLRSIEASAMVETTLNVFFKGGVTNYEGIAVDQAAGLILIVEKALLGGRVYSIPLPRVEDLGKEKTDLTATPIGQTSIPFACACDISNDGNWLVITNMTLGYLFSRLKPADGKPEDWSDTLKREPFVFRLPKMRQSEAVCFSRDDHSLFLTSEQRPTPLIEMTLPTAH